MSLLGEGSTKLPLLVEKALLQMVEKMDQAREDVVFKDVCDGNKELFGDRSSKTRQNMRDYWKNIKRRSTRSYASHLTKLGIPHSNTTKALLEAEQRVPSPDPTEDEDDEESTDEDSSILVDDSDDEEEEEVDTKQLTESFGGFNLNNAPSTPVPNNTSVTPPPPNDTAPSAAFNPPIPSHFMPTHFSPSRSILSPPQLASNSMSKNNSTEYVDWSGGSPPLTVPSSASSSSSGGDTNNWYGSMINPIVIYANLDFPERNFPFDITFIPRIEHNGWAREGVDIRALVGIGDSDSWNAWIDNNNTSGNSIMVQGRSRSSAYDLALESYHRNDSNSDAAAKHRKTAEEILKTPHRQAMYWRILFPKEMPLDNVIISGDSVHIKKNEVGTSHLVGGSVDCKSYFVNWVIAKKDAGHQVTPAKKTKLADAFA